MTGTEVTRLVRAVRRIGDAAQRSFVALGEGVFAGEQDATDDQNAHTDGRYGDENARAGRLPVSPVTQRTQQLPGVTRRHHQRARRRHVGHCDVSST